MFHINKLNLVVLSVLFIVLSPSQASAKTFRWTDRGTATDTDDGKEYRTTIKYRVEIDKVDVCTIKLHINAKMKGKNSRNTISYSTYVDGDSVSLSYGQTFSYTRPKNQSGKMLTIDGYNKLQFKGKKEIFTKDQTIVNLRATDFDLYDFGDGLDELNQYTSRLTKKCEAHDAKKKKERDAYFKSQTVYYDDETSHARSKRALRHLTSKKYLNSVNFNSGSGKNSDFFMANGKSHANEKRANIYKIKDKDIGSCVAQQGQRFNDFFKTEKQNADKAKIIPWMYSFNVKTPVLHLLDTRQSGNEGARIKAHLSKDANWHIYFVLGKPSSTYDENKKDSYCYTVSSNHLVGLTNKFYKNNKFQSAKAKLDDKLKTSIAKANQKRAAENKKRFYAAFKKDPERTLKSIENNLKDKLSKLDAKTLKSNEFIKKIEKTRKDYLKVMKLVKKSHPVFYKKNIRRFKSKDWYKRYLRHAK